MEFEKIYYMIYYYLKTPHEHDTHEISLNT